MYEQRTNNSLPFFWDLTETCLNRTAQKLCGRVCRWYLDWVWAVPAKIGEEEEEEAAVTDDCNPALWTLFKPLNKFKASSLHTWPCLPCIRSPQCIFSICYLQSMYYLPTVRMTQISRHVLLHNYCHLPWGISVRILCRRVVETYQREVNAWVAFLVQSSCSPSIAGMQAKMLSATLSAFQSISFLDVWSFFHQCSVHAFDCCNEQ